MARGLFGGLTSLAFINAAAHSHCTAGHLLCAKHKHKQHRDPTAVKETLGPKYNYRELT